MMTNLQKLRKALRFVIADQIIAFKNKTFFKIGRDRCPVTGERISFETCHIDHIAPLTFEKLVDDFLVYRGINVDRIEFELYPGAKEVETIKDKKLQQDFWQYHKDHAKLQAVSRTANLSILRKRKEVGRLDFKTVGAGWKRTSRKSGTEYISIALDKDKLTDVANEDYKKFCLFTNKFKESDKHPDYTLMVPLPEGTEAGEAAKTN